MLSSDEEKYILSKAYIPEHIINLMVSISKGEPELVNDYLYFSKDEWVIFVGYPLCLDFKTKDLEKTISEVMKRKQPKYIWLISSEIPEPLSLLCHKRESDYYYKLQLSSLIIKRDLTQQVKKASRDLTIERGQCISKEHIKLISEFLKRENPNPLIRELFLSMQEYVKQSKTAIVLSAFNKNNELTAFYVIELAAREFAAYVVGCYSKKNYIPHASDFLFYEMINLAKEHNKSYIHLGLGVNEGIRRFKEKWGGIPFLRYEFCEYITGYNNILEMLKSFESKL